jgi:hypothetical protein
VQFQVKGQEYFLAFVEDERRWYLFSPTPQGMQRIPVYVDAVKWERMGSSEKVTDTIKN